MQPTKFHVVFFEFALSNLLKTLSNWLFVYNLRQGKSPFGNSIFISLTPSFLQLDLKTITLKLEGI
jgi:hypothetical protein